MKTVGNQTFELDKEHQALEQEVEDWREWWRELREIGEPRFGEMGGRLAHFRSHLEKHFLHEQTRGLLAESAKTLTPQGEWIRNLWVEHEDLLSELDTIIERLNACGSNTVCWGDARSVFESFLDRLQEHDAQERRLLEELDHAN